MSLLWSAAVQHLAMPWDHSQDKIFSHPVVHPTRKAGYAGYVGHDFNEEDSDDEPEAEPEFDEDLYDTTTPEPTAEEEAHYEEHGDYPESLYERHDQAYQDALEHRRREEEPDLHDNDLHRLIRLHGSDADVWDQHGTLGPVRLHHVYATQPLVSQTHIDRYADNPQDQTHMTHQRGPSPLRYLGDEHPIFVTHQGRLHAIEGHHRVAAALQRGDDKITGWHYDLDRDPADLKNSEEWQEHEEAYG